MTSPSALVDELLLQANSSIPGQLFWSANDKFAYNSALDVEVTAYTVLSLVMHDRMSEALKAIKWMATKRNSRGGFVSTQDTMVALQAMSQYSLKLRSGTTDLKVDVKSLLLGSSDTFELDEDNLLLLQREKIHQLPAKLQLDVEGTGCYMVQTVLRYEIYLPSIILQFGIY
jgi:hypothetical protein